ncbi:MAG: ribosome-binding factor A, partial [Deinococcota bacterium]|nr:ribosome-binding factor A [Deinococcota bacterium]
DPRVPMIVTVERVRLSADLSSAKVLVSALSDESLTELEAALNGASGHLQRGIGRDLKAKKTPRLSFHIDPLAVI